MRGSSKRGHLKGDDLLVLLKKKAAQNTEPLLTLLALFIKYKIMINLFNTHQERSLFTSGKQKS
jgi:hypothetical protein